MTNAGAASGNDATLIKHSGRVAYGRQGGLQKEVEIGGHQRSSGLGPSHISRHQEGSRIIFRRYNIPTKIGFLRGVTMGIVVRAAPA